MMTEATKPLRETQGCRLCDCSEYAEELVIGNYPTCQCGHTENQHWVPSAKARQVQGAVDQCPTCHAPAEAANLVEHGPTFEVLECPTCGTVWDDRGSVWDTWGDYDQDRAGGFYEGALSPASQPQPAPQPASQPSHKVAKVEWSQHPDDSTLYVSDVVNGLYGIVFAGGEGTTYGYDTPNPVWVWSVEDDVSGNVMDSGVESLEYAAREAVEKFMRGYRTAGRTISEAEAQARRRHPAGKGLPMQTVATSTTLYPVIDHRSGSLYDVHVMVSDDEMFFEQQPVSVTVCGRSGEWSGVSLDGDPGAVPLAEEDVRYVSCSQCRSVAERHFSVPHQASRRTAGETTTVMPSQVDTFRDDACPVCGSSDYLGQRCASCGFVRPPVVFQDPNTDAMQERPESPPAGDLACNECGMVYPATDTSIPATEASSPANPSEVSDPVLAYLRHAARDPQVGDVCPSCNKGTLLLKEDVDGVEPGEIGDATAPQINQMPAPEATDGAVGDDEAVEGAEVPPTGSDPAQADSEPVEADSDDRDIPEPPPLPGEETADEPDDDDSDDDDDDGDDDDDADDEDDGDLNPVSQRKAAKERMRAARAVLSQKEKSMSDNRQHRQASEDDSAAQRPRQSLHSVLREQAGRLDAQANLIRRQAAQNAVLRQAVLTLAHQSKNRSVVASLGGRVASGEAPSTDEAAAAPEATTDVESTEVVVTDAVTPEATTDVETEGTAIVEQELTNLQDVEQVHESTDDATGETQVTTAAKTDERTWAAMHLAKVRREAGLTAEDAVVLGQKIARDESVTVSDMEVEIKALESVVASRRTARTQPRHLVPRAANRTPSLASHARASGGGQSTGNVDIEDSLY